MGPKMVNELVLDALMMAIWRREPKQRMTIHAD
jgi:transposase InsO family protein